MVTPPPKAYYELTNRVLSYEDREKFEWAAGSLLAGGPPHISVLFGPRRSGKTTLTTLIRRVMVNLPPNGQTPQVLFDRWPSVHEEEWFAGNAHVFVESHLIVEVEGSIRINMSGGRHPVDKYHGLLDAMELELDAISEQWTNKYHTLGENYYEEIRENY